MFGIIVVLLAEAKALIVAKATLLVIAVVTSGAVVATVVVASKVDFPTDPLTVIEQPRLGQAVKGTIEVTGFSIDRNTKTGTGVSKVVLYLDGVDEQHKLGAATLGLDSAKALTYRTDGKDERFEKAGWTFTWAVPELVGNSVLFVVASSSDTPARSSITALELNDPLVRITHPEPGAKVGGALDVRGWALDRYTPEGTTTAPQIDRVEIYLDDELQGTAQLGLASPEKVRERYGVVEAGWSFSLDVSELEPGEHVVRAVAHSAVQDSQSDVEILVVVFDPYTLDGCGRLVGGPKGQAIQALQAGWKHFHGLTQSFQSKNGTTAREHRDALKGTVHATREALHARRQEAKRELNAKAKEYLALCHAGVSPDVLVVTTGQDVVSVSHLKFEYRSIVDVAVADMERIYEQAEPILVALSTSTSATGEARGQGSKGRGKP